MNACASCGDSLSIEGDFVVCSCCKRKLHFQCTTISEKSWRTLGIRKESWRCQFCRNSNSSEADPSKSQTPDMQAAKCTRPTNSPNKNDEASRNNDNHYQTVLNEIRQMRDQLSKITASCEFLGNKYDDINANMIKNNALIENFTKEINELKETNKKKDIIIESMQTQINNIEQQMLSNNIDIKNIPITPQENLIEIVKGIGTTIENVINDNDITDIYRTNIKNPEKSNIIVKFASNQCKTKFIKQARSTRPIKLSAVRQNTNNVNNINSTRVEFDATIYVNNQLTKHNKHLLWLTKEKAKQENWKYVWESAGKILARRSENTQSIIINTDNDVNNIRSTL